MKKEYVSLKFMEERATRLLRGILSMVFILIILGLVTLISSIFIEVSVSAFFTILFLVFFISLYVWDIRIGFIENLIYGNNKQKNFKVWFGIMEGYTLTRKQLNYLEKNKIKFKKGMFKKSERREEWIKEY